MNENLDPTQQHLSASDKEFERAIRPAQFTEFQGQKQVLENLMVFVHAAKGRGEALDHVLLHGPPGLGKTTLSHIIARNLRACHRQAWRFGRFAHQPGTS